MSLAEALTERYQALVEQRSRFEQTWKLIARYVLPRKASFYETDSSTNLARERQVLDSTAPRALELFSAFMHSSLSSPASRWFELVPVGRTPEEVRRDIPLARWLDDLRQAVMTELTAGQTNIYTALHELYIDLGAFGTAVVYVDQDENGRLKFQNYHLATVVLDESAGGEIDTFGRKVLMTPRQARQKWPGRTIGRAVDEATPVEMVRRRVEFLHFVFPSTDEDLVDLLPEPVPFPWVSVWVNVEDQVVVSVAGYREKPFMAPRWLKTRQEVYGRSPAMTVIGDILMVNRMAATVLRGAEKLVDPPLLIPDGALLSPLRAFPGGISYSDGQIQPVPLLPPGASRIELGDALIEKRQQAIREGFFVPLFITSESPVMTATQVMQITDERNRATAPMITRLHHELFTPLLRRILSALEDAGRLPAPPAGVDIRGIDVEFTSPVIASQRMQSGMAIARLFELVSPWYQVDRGSFDWLDTDEVVRALHLATGAPMNVLNTRSHVEAVRRKRQEAEDALVAQQQALAAVEATAKLQAAQK